MVGLSKRQPELKLAQIVEGQPGVEGRPSLKEAGKVHRDNP